MNDPWDLTARAIVDVVALAIIAFGAYFPVFRRHEYVFAMVILNLVVFFVCLFLSSAEVSLGFAFGLFAILAILRYRTDGIAITEMTFLFASLTIGIINALASPLSETVASAISNGSIVATVLILTLVWLSRRGLYRLVTYDKISLIPIDKRAELIQDLSVRTGLDVINVDIMSINFLNDTASLRVYYKPGRQE